MNKTSTLQTLRDFISIQSVSTDPLRFSEIQKAASFLTKKLESLGFNVHIIQQKDTPPLLIAVRNKFPKAKTIGIYGHYDVQPEEPLDQWKSSPFKLSQREGKFFGRGVADDKGHVIQNIAAIESLIRNNTLTNNIIFVLEGEEETGSAHFEELIAQKHDLLSDVDVFYITDVGMHAKNIPQIFYALRGIIYFELIVSIGMRDLHSGIYGNSVYNPAQIIANLMSAIKDSSGNIRIPKFYAKVRKISAEELQTLNKLKRSMEEEKQAAGVDSFVSMGDVDYYVASKIYPSFDINGIQSGYTGTGSKTIIPREAMVKFSFRLIEHQDPEEIEQLVTEFIQKNIPSGIRYTLRVLAKQAPFYTDTKNVYAQRTAQFFTEYFHHQTLFNRSGGSIPAAEIFQRLYKKPVILTGFTLPDDNIHAPNENIDEEMFWMGIEALSRVYCYSD